MTTYSILRTKEDQELARITLTGRVIDLGGHKGSSYYKLLKTEQPIEVANMDSTNPGTHKTPSGADHVFDLEKSFPLPSGSFDAVLCINVMEHIYNYKNLLSESSRILKSGGRIYISVPFFFNIHGSPNDYFRYTKSALERILADHGFMNISIKELGDGPCSAIFQTFGGSIPTMMLRLLFKRIAIGIDQCFSRLSSRYALIRTRVPLGYFVSAEKP
jgi:SAM-dependent methyltransferase